MSDASVGFVSPSGGGRCLSTYPTRKPDVDTGTIIVADGFSCKTQIVQGTDRRALHTAQVTKMALDHGTGGTPRASVPSQATRASFSRGRPGPKMAAAGAALVGAAALAWATGKRDGR